MIEKISEILNMFAFSIFSVMNSNKANFNFSRFCSSNNGNRNQTNMVNDDSTCDSMSIISIVSDSQVKEASIFITTFLKSMISSSQTKLAQSIQLCQHLKVFIIYIIILKTKISYCYYLFSRIVNKNLKIKRKTFFY
jgi:hypothetical protein